MGPNHKNGQSELRSAFGYIAVVGILVWWPLLAFLGKPNPLALFDEWASFGAALMFAFGAMIASATAIGGGMVFNPTLQFAFSVSGYSALALAILAQCAGMCSGSYGWYRKGEYAVLDRRFLVSCIAVTLALTAVWSIVLIQVVVHATPFLPLLMKLALAGTSFYVFRAVLQEQRVARAAAGGAAGGPGPKPAGAAAPQFDRGLFLTLVLGTLLNAFTAVGVGKLSVTDLIKRLGAPVKTAVAIGTLLQATSVVTQTVFMLVFLAYLIPLKLA